MSWLRRMTPLRLAGGRPPALALIAALMVLAACSQPALTPTPAPIPTPTFAFPDLGEPVDGGVLRTWIPLEPSQLDLHFQKDRNASAVILPLMNWLVANYQGREGIAPDLAERWEVGGSGDVYTFSLTQRAAWHDGLPLTAEDVVFSLRRITEGIGAKPYQHTLSSVEAVEVVDDFTVRVRLGSPDPAFLAGLGALGNVIYPAHFSFAELSEFRPIGTGPFKLRTRFPGVKIELERNAAYFKQDQAGRPLPYLDGIEFILMGNAETGFAALQAGQLDLSWAAGPHLIGESREEVQSRLRGLEVNAFPSVSYTLLFPNRPPWQEQRLRRAVHMAFDREAFNDAVSLGYGEPATFLMPPREALGRWALSAQELRQLPGYGPQDEELPAALELLRLSGVVPPASPLIVGLDSQRGTFEAAYSQLRALLGVDTRLLLQPGPAFHASRVAQEFDTLLDTQPIVLDDPTSLLDPQFRSFGLRNFGRWSDPEVDELLDLVASTLDPVRRRQHAEGLQRALIDRSWLVLLGTGPFIQAHSPMLTGYWAPLHPEDGPSYRLEDVWLSEVDDFTRIPRFPVHS